MKEHAHTFVDAGPEMSITVIPSRCRCGKTRLEFVNPITNRRTGLALPLDVVKMAAAGKEVLAGVGGAFELGANVLERLRQLGLLR